MVYLPTINVECLAALKWNYVSYVRFSVNEEHQVIQKEKHISTTKYVYIYMKKANRTTTVSMYTFKTNAFHVKLTSFNLSGVSISFNKSFEFLINVRAIHLFAFTQFSLALSSFRSFASALPVPLPFPFRFMCITS